MSVTYRETVTVIKQPSKGSGLGQGPCSSSQLRFWLMCLLDPPSVPVCLMFQHWCLIPLDGVARVPYMGAMALWELPCLTAALCSAMWDFSYLPVSPMYTGPHSHGGWSISLLGLKCLVQIWPRVDMLKNHPLCCIWCGNELLFFNYSVCRCN